MAITDNPILLHDLRCMRFWEGRKSPTTIVALITGAALVAAAAGALADAGSARGAYTTGLASVGIVIAVQSIAVSVSLALAIRSRRWQTLVEHLRATPMSCDAIAWPLRLRVILPVCVSSVFIALFFVWLAVAAVGLRTDSPAMSAAVLIAYPVAWCLLNLLTLLIQVSFIDPAPEPPLDDALMFIFPLCTGAFFAIILGNALQAVPWYLAAAALG